MAIKFEIGQIVNGLRIIDHVKGEHYVVRCVSCRYTYHKKASAIRNKATENCSHCKKLKKAKTFDIKQIKSTTFGYWLTISWLKSTT